MPQIPEVQSSSAVQLPVAIGLTHAPALQAKPLAQSVAVAHEMRQPPSAVQPRLSGTPCCHLRAGSAHAVANHAADHPVAADDPRAAGAGVGVDARPGAVTADGTTDGVARRARRRAAPGSLAVDGRAAAGNARRQQQAHPQYPAIRFPTRHLPLTRPATLAPSCPSRRASPRRRTCSARTRGSPPPGRPSGARPRTAGRTPSWWR